ncbi:MAG: hypothetical protein QM538_06190 [Methylacidiphilales bacterium]|nr:hypothetical protein [Candidatus Methylacidiphilales bacterium]
MKNISNLNPLPAFKFFLLGLLLSNAFNAIAIDYINLNVNLIDGESPEWRKKEESTVNDSIIYANNYWTESALNNPKFDLDYIRFTRLTQSVIDQLASKYRKDFARGIDKDLIRLLAERQTTVEVARTLENGTVLIMKGTLDSSALTNSIKDFTVGIYDRMKRYQENPASCVASGLTCYADYARFGTINYDDIESVIKVFKLENTIEKEKEFKAKKLELIKSLQETVKSIKSNLKIAVILECKGCFDKEIKPLQFSLINEIAADESRRRRIEARTKYGMQDVIKEFNDQLQKSLTNDFVANGYTTPLFLTSTPDTYDSQTLYIYVNYTIIEMFGSGAYDNKLYISFTTLGVLGSKQSNFLVTDYFTKSYFETPIPAFVSIVPKSTRVIIENLNNNFLLYSY